VGHRAHRLTASTLSRVSLSRA
jgi:photosystem I subunit PsaN